MAAKSIAVHTERELIDKCDAIEKSLLDFFEKLKNNLTISEIKLEKIINTINKFTVKFITKNSGKLTKTALNRLAKKTKKLQRYSTAIVYFMTCPSVYRPEAIDCYLSLKAIIEKPIIILKNKSLKSSAHKLGITPDFFYLDILEIAQIKLAKIIAELNFFESHVSFSVFLPRFMSESEVHHTIQPFQERAKKIENLNEIKQELKKLKLALFNIPENKNSLVQIDKLLEKTAYLRAEYSRMPVLLKKAVFMTPVLPKPPHQLQRATIFSRKPSKLTQA